MGPRHPTLLQIHPQVSWYLSQQILPKSYLHHRYKFTATPGSEKIPVDGTCFSSAEVTSATLESGAVEVTIHLGLPTSLLCHASFILATDKHVELKEVTTSSRESWQPPPKDPDHKSIPCCSSGSLATTQLLFQPSPTPLLPRTGIFIRGAINSQREENYLLHSGDPESFCIQYRQKRYLTVFHSQREKQCHNISMRSAQNRWRTISPPPLPSSSPVSHKVYPTTLQTWTGKTETKQSSLKHFSLENSWVPLSGLICLKENLLQTSSRSEWIYPSEWCFVWKGAWGIDQERRHIWHNETWWAWSHDR